MLHENRTFGVSDVARPGDLVAKFKGDVSVWCGCTGWRHKGWLWLNDSTSPDAIQEYAVVHEGTMVQWESLTITWMSADEIRKFIQDFEEGTAERPYFGAVSNKIETPAEHGRCQHCA